MKYNLTDLQQYDTSTLQDELTTAGITSSINGHGAKSFNVTTDDEAGADVVVQLHLNKSEAQHDLDMDDLDKENYLEATLNSPRDILKALVLCINDGSIVPGANVSNAALKAAIKAKL